MSSSTSPGREAIDRVVGAVKEAAGKVTGNEHLQHEGGLHREKADASREARQEAERADLAQARTEAEIAEREAAVERDALLTEARAEHEELHAEVQAQQAERAIDNEQHQHEEAANRTEEVRQAAAQQSALQADVQREREQDQADGLRAAADSNREQAAGLLGEERTS